MLQRMWKKGNPSNLLVGMLIGAVTVESIVELPQNTKNGPSWVAQLVGASSRTPNGSTLCQGTYLGWRFDFWFMLMGHSQSIFLSHIDLCVCVSLSLPPSLPLFLKAIKIPLHEDF